MILQLFNVIGGFASAGFSDSISDRVIGLTGGPWEIGLIINFIFAIYLFDEKQYPGIKINLIFIITFLLILLTGSRMATIAHLLLFLIYKYNKSANKSLFAFSLTFYVLLLISLILFIPNQVTERSAGLFSKENIDEFFIVYRRMQINHPFTGLPLLENTNISGGDLSWIMRVTKWTYIFKDFFGTPYTWFIGFGPGLWGSAVDGGWVRLLTECGIIGSSFFIFFFKKAIQFGKPVFGVVLSLYISMIMIDVNISYKAMAFVFFTVGYYYQKSVHQSGIYLNQHYPDALKRTF
jgi:hypothetical protein